jgi:hypothetical protein
MNSASFAQGVSASSVSGIDFRIVQMIGIVLGAVRRNCRIYHGLRGPVAFDGQR